MPQNSYYTARMAETFAHNYVGVAVSFRAHRTIGGYERLRSTSLQKHASGILNVLLHLDQELHRFSAVQQSVIVGESQVHHRPDLNLAVDGNGSLLDGMETKNGTLGEVDDGSTHERAENTTVADCEGTASHVLDGQFVITSLES